jgi:hypothetical protein
MKAPYTILGWLRDSAIGFALIVGGLAIVQLAVWNFVMPGAPWNTILICLALLPFIWFAKRRQVLRVTWWGYLAFAIFCTAFIGVDHYVRRMWGRSISIVVAVGLFSCVLWVYPRVRKFIARDDCAT